MAQEITRVKPRQLVLAALVRSRNLGVLGTAAIFVACCFASGAPIVGGIVLGAGALAYLSSVGHSILSESFMAEVCGLNTSGAAPKRLSPPRAIRYPVLRESLERIHNKVDELDRQIGTAPDLLRSSLASSGQRCSSVVSSAHALAERGQRILDYLSAIDRVALEKNFIGLHRRIHDTSDEHVATVYCKAYDARRRHLTTCNRLQSMYDCVIGRLQLIECSLDGARATVVKLVVGDEHDSSFKEDMAIAELDTIIADIELLDVGLDELAEISLDDDDDDVEITDLTTATEQPPPLPVRWRSSETVESTDPLELGSAPVT